MRVFKIDPTKFQDAEAMKAAAQLLMRGQLETIPVRFLMPEDFAPGELYPFLIEVIAPEAPKGNPEGEKRQGKKYPPRKGGYGYIPSISADDVARAEKFLNAYSGAHPFLTSVSAALKKYGKLTPRQIVAALAFIDSGKEY